MQAYSLDSSFRMRHFVRTAHTKSIGGGPMFRYACMTPGIIIVVEQYVVTCVGGRV